MLDDRAALVEPRPHLSHLLVEDRSADQEFRRRGGGNAKVRPIEDRAGHGAGRLTELQQTLELAGQARDDADVGAELRALGTVIVIEGADAAYPLALDRLERRSTHRGPARRPMWLLLSVLPADSDRGLPERATVWVADGYRDKFIALFEDYLARSGPAGNPLNNQLVANIAQIRRALVADLWQSDGEPPTTGTHWWEVWLRPDEDGPDLLRRFASMLDLTMTPRVLRLVDRDVTWVRGTWAQLQPLAFTAVPIAEVRRPEFVDTIEDLPPDDHLELAGDLAGRVRHAPPEAPAVCHLDSGVARTHLLLRDSLHERDLHTVVGISGADRQGHGTRMAGIALYGNLDPLLLETADVNLRHRLESVRILPHGSEPDHDPLTYGDVTAQAVASVEASSDRDRVFCLPVTATGDVPDKPGQPTLWSATVDALAVGSDVVRVGEELQLLSTPDPDAARLVIISAGNVDTYTENHLDQSDSSPVQDPAQAWNALTVGAHTELTDLPDHPDYSGWTTIADEGQLSPHSRTSLLFGTHPWPVKPDIVMEGGNVLHDGAGAFDPAHTLLSLRTTGHANDGTITSARATSAATAAASRLACLAMATYPGYWPETVRALLVHGAEWTPAMRRELSTARVSGRRAQQRMLRRYGWGVPTEDRVLYSTGQAVTLVVQDRFVPFSGPGFTIPAFRLHDLPWPRETLGDLGDASVDLRVTLSYFVEPTASRRGWRRRYSYASHQLRFEAQDPLESESQFVQRVNREARAEEDGDRPGSSGVEWLVGPQQRNLGSLHQDVWSSTGVELASSGRLAVYPVGGWWKNNGSKSRVDQPVRYSLVISLRTAEQEVDLYTPISTALRIPTTIPVE